MHSISHQNYRDQIKFFVHTSKFVMKQRKTCYLWLQAGVCLACYPGHSSPVYLQARSWGREEGRWTGQVVGEEAQLFKLWSV